MSGRSVDVPGYTAGKPLDPGRPCVVFVHGASNDHSVWTLAARWFANHGWSVLAVDLPGHGRTPGPLLPDVESAAGWLWDTLDAAGVRRVALVGHSMGSLVALEAAGQQPDRTTHLAMVATAYPMKVADALLTTAQDDPQRAMAMVNAWSLSSTACKPGYPGPGSWLHGGGLALMRRMQSRAPTGANLFHHDFDVCNRYRGGEAAAARVACPVTMILGAVDQMTRPKDAKSLAATLQARVVTVAAGHQLMAEAPDETLAALREALGA